MNEAKTMQNFAKRENFAKNYIQLQKKTCGILCFDSSVFEVLLCHNTNFSSFTLNNV